MALALIDRLQWEPMSQFRASAAGTDDFIGWDRTTTALSQIYNVNAAQAAGKKLKKDQLYPVPEVKKAKAPKQTPTSVRELNWATLMGGVGDG